MTATTRPTSTQTRMTTSNLNSFRPASSESTGADARHQDNSTSPGRPASKLKSKKTVRFEEDFPQVDTTATILASTRKPRSKTPTAVVGDDYAWTKSPSWASSKSSSRPSRPSMSTMPRTIGDAIPQRSVSQPALKFTTHSPRSVARAQTSSSLVAGRPGALEPTVPSPSHTRSEPNSTGKWWNFMRFRASIGRGRAQNAPDSADTPRGKGSPSKGPAAGATLQPPTNENEASSGGSSQTSWSSGFSAVTASGGLGAPVQEHMIRRDPKTGHRYITQSFAGLDL